jgi:hypothetical protein
MYMAPLGAITPGRQLAVCLTVRLIVIKRFSSLRPTRSQTQAALYKTGPRIVSSILFTRSELFSTVMVDVVRHCVPRVVNADEEEQKRGGADEEEAAAGV